MGIIKHPKLEALERECAKTSMRALDEAEAFQFAEFDAKEVERTGYSNYSYWGSTFRAFCKNQAGAGPRLHCADHPGVHVFAAVPSRAVRRLCREQRPGDRHPPAQRAAELRPLAGHQLHRPGPLVPAVARARAPLC